MTGRDPSSFPRRILLATVGLSPQIVTETLYALAVPNDPAHPGLRRDPPFVPTEIHIITTQEGRHRAILSLLDPSTAVLAEFAREFELPQLVGTLTPERIHVIRDAAGKTLPDIGSGADSEAAADLVVAVVRELTRDEDAALYVSIAGGRKTMGFLLGYALSLFGRDQDRVTHVLVDPSLENHPQFFYPPRVPRVLHTRDGRPVNTAHANLSLAEIPFVSLRQGLPQGLLDGQASFSETVAHAKKGFAEPTLIVDVANRRLSCHDVIITLPPLPFAIYAWLARRRLESSDGDGATHWSAADPEDLLAEYRAIAVLPDGALREQEERLRPVIPSDTLEQNKARINAELRKALGRSAEAYLIHPRGRVPGTRYERIGLKLMPQAILFQPVELTQVEPRRGKRWLTSLWPLLG
jgi:CRISPR-associated protein (TIGR02584 family)